MTFSADGFGVPAFCLIFAPSKGYDEPEILPSSLSQFCLTGADAGQSNMAMIMSIVNRFLSNMMMLLTVSEGSMKTDAEWRAQVKGILKAELKRRNVSYQQLADRLSEMGVYDTPANIANKISRGGFTAVFMAQCLEAIDCASIRFKSE